jgi:putative ABC transport system permease protein
MLQDIRFALRALAQHPWFSVVAITILAMGIGANTAIFSVVNAVLLRSLPFAEPDRLVGQVAIFRHLGEGKSIPYKDFEEWNKRKDIFSAAAVTEEINADLSSDAGQSERVTAASVSEDFFTVLHAAPVAGRTFSSSDHLEGAEGSVVISDGLWKRRFGGDRSLIGRTIRVRGTERRVIGVVDATGEYPLGTQLWIPIVTSSLANEPVDNFEYQGIARLAPGIPLEQAKAYVASVGERMAHDHPAKRRDTAMSVISLKEYVVGSQLRRALYILLATVGIVLLIASANLANLLLNRSIARAKEFSIRSALGASPWRLVRQIIVEAGVLCVAGATAGLAIAQVLVHAFIAFGPASIPRLAETSLDVRTFCFALFVTATTAMLFSLAPALRIARQDLRDGLQESGQSFSVSKGSQRYREVLVVAQIALSLVLLVAAGLIIKSFMRLQHVNPGIRTSNLLTFELSLPGPVYTKEKRAQFILELQNRLNAMPGVQVSGAITALPMGGGGFYLGRAFIEQGHAEPPNGPEYSGMWEVITPGFIGATDLPLLSGRDFSQQDTASSLPVAIINRTMARQMFGGQDPIGKVIRSWRDENKPRQIIGVVADLKVTSLDERTQGIVYVPYPQDPFSMIAYVVRTKGDPSEIVSSVRHELEQMDRNVAMANVSTMSAVREVALAQPKFNTLLISSFSAAALALSIIGLFGVLAYSVTQRTREIGIRMALGAQRENILVLVLSQGARLVGFGLLIGALTAFFASRLLTHVLYDVSAYDPIVHFGFAVVLAATALLATYVPARRATRIDPLTALRHE